MREDFAARQAGVAPEDGAGPASTSPSTPVDRDVLGVYRDLLAMGSRPALTWYGHEGRIELSGRVAANHLAKIAGYLLDEVWLEPGARLRLALPAHFKQVLWAAGALLAGARVECEDSPSRPGLFAVVAYRHESLTSQSWDAEEVLALDLSPLATSWTGPALPAGVRDAAAEVMGAPDALIDEQAYAACNAEEFLGLQWHRPTPEQHGSSPSAPTPASALARPSGKDVSTSPASAPSAPSPAADPPAPAPASSHPAPASPHLEPTPTNTRPNPGPRNLLVAPTPSSAVGAALSLLGRERLVVVEDGNQSEHIRKIEHL